MGTHFLQGMPDVPIVLRRSARSRRISLRVSQLDGRVTLTLPSGVPEADALAFAREKETWIRDHLSKRGVDVVVAPGCELPLGGRTHQVVLGTGRVVEITDGMIAVPGKAERVGPSLLGHLKQLARDRLASACDHYSARLGRPYNRISIRDTRSRWGSCSSQGTLMFSWRLIMAPPEVLDYVAAHEVAHLAQMNHSPAFWADVARIHGPYQDPCGWLRTQGNGLHRYRFTD